MRVAWGVVMIQEMLISPTSRMIEQAVNFTEQRHQVIVANIANASTPGYVQKDVSAVGFQAALRDAVDRRRLGGGREVSPVSNDTVEFYRGSSQIGVKPQATVGAMAFHDRGVRSMESLMSDLADNAMAHNALVQLLKGRYEGIVKAINMRP